MKALYLVVIVAVIVIGTVVLYVAGKPGNNPLSVSTTAPLTHQLNNTTMFIPELVPTNRTIVLEASEQNMSIRYIETLNYNSESFHFITSEWGGIPSKRYW